VENSFQITPYVKGSLQWKEDQLLFMPYKPFDSTKVYEISFSMTKQDKILNLGNRTYKFKISIRAPSILYISESDGNLELWKNLPDGSEPIVMTETEGKLYDYKVSRNGDYIAYSVTNDQDGRDIWLMDRDGKNMKQIFDCQEEDRFNVSSWSPHGKIIAFSLSKKSESFGISKILFYNLDNDDTILFNDAKSSAVLLMEICLHIMT